MHAKRRNRTRSMLSFHARTSCHPELYAALRVSCSAGRTDFWSHISEAEFLKQQDRQYEDRSWCGIPPQNFERACFQHRLRLATKSKQKVPSHTPFKKCHKKPLRATEKPPRATSRSISSLARAWKFQSQECPYLHGYGRIYAWTTLCSDILARL